MVVGSTFVGTGTCVHERRLRRFPLWIRRVSYRRWFHRCESRRNRFHLAYQRRAISLGSRTIPTERQSACKLVCGLVIKRRSLAYNHVSRIRCRYSD